MLKSEHSITRLSILFFFFYSAQISAGKLADFENDISRSKSERSQDRTSSSSKCHSCGSTSLSDSFFDALFEGILTGLVDGTAEIIAEGSDNSQQRVNKNADHTELSLRKHGEILIPYYRLNLNFQRIDSDIDGYDVKMEFGKGPFGLELRATRYKDDTTNEDLNYSQLQYFHRMSFGNSTGVNLGLGYGRLKGNTLFDGFILSLPILYKASDNVGFELRPLYFNASGVDITELDASILYTHRKLAFRAGYRSIQSDNVDISGFYLGMDFIF
ncbi:hypothetical protein MNBD_GAMMA11-2404 [hydrothermal vent metagenome]|uniref:Uncharacterized protein n=1 Tax=hydrothermal vent metagenome TaxID=652676 RepID=A0A3B0X9L8_9ZZZZ